MSQTAADTPRVSNAPAWMNISAVVALLGATVSRLCRAKRLLILGILYLMPTLIILLVRSQGAHTNTAELDFVMMLNMVPNAIIPFASLLLSSGLIPDEVEEQTLTYLLLRPLPRWMIYVVKVMGALAVACSLAVAGTVVNEMVIHWNAVEPFGPSLGEAISHAVKLSGLYSLISLAYCSVFALVGMIFRRSLPIGVVYIVVFEGMFASMDFVVRKYTVMNAFRIMALKVFDLSAARRMNLLDAWTAQDADATSGIGDAVTTLAVIAVVLIAIGAWICTFREFRVKSPEAA